MKVERRAERRDEEIVRSALRNPERARSRPALLGAPSASKGGAIPAHVAIIMDGNGRWAANHKLPRAKGHQEGANSVREVVRVCGEKGVKELTLYAFSTENWRRPRIEVAFLMRLLSRFLVSEREELRKNNVRMQAIGRLNELPQAVRKELRRTISESAGNSGLILRLALNYGGRAEILDAVRRIAQDFKQGLISLDDIGEELFRRYTYDPDMTDPDLIIRTAGEMRVSNFLLWHLSYAELWVTPVCWPEFRRPEMEQAIEAFARRQRRFGGVIASRPADANEPAEGMQR